jgi:hypothetical protein
MAIDELNIATASSGVNVSRVGPAAGVPSTGNVTAAESNDVEGLLHGGDHHDDMNRNVRRQDARCTLRLFWASAAPGTTLEELPRQTLMASVVNQGLKRPKPRSW